MIEKLRNNNLLLLLFLTLVLIIDQFLTIPKKASVITLLFLFVIIFVNINLKSNVSKEYKVFNYDFYSNYPTGTKIFSSLYLLLLVLVTQNYLLNYEIIDWDISSYMVASNDISRGFLPNETQWESKGPVLIYMYSLLLKIAGGNFLIFKVINDILLFIISLILYMSTIKVKSNVKKLNLIPPTLFILFMSQPWGLSGYSEIYSLLFISFSYYLYKSKTSKQTYYLIGILLSLSTLVNQGTILYLLGFLLILFNKSAKHNLRKILLSFLIPHIFFLLLYFYKNLLNIYIETFVNIPIAYTSASYSNLYELKVYLRKFYEYETSLYFIFVIVLFSILAKSLSSINNFKNILGNDNFIFILISLSFYFIASHNYYHHTIFLLYFLSLYVQNISNSNTIYLISVLTVFSALTLTISYGSTSAKNLYNHQSIYDNYPLKSLAAEIDSLFDEDYNVLALEYNLLLHYLDKPNYSYIVHHTNFLEPYILSSLQKINFIEENYAEYLITKKPDVIICSDYMIVRGDVIKSPIIKCNPDDMPEGYLSVNTEEYFTENLNFYRDPYKEIYVFVNNKK
ncbi:hypothetical protein N8776_01695 [bacterium]|nr:hypothetical protein [bacterium]